VCIYCHSTKDIKYWIDPGYTEQGKIKLEKFSQILIYTITY